MMAKVLSIFSVFLTSIVLYLWINSHASYDNHDPIYNIPLSEIGELDDEKILYFYNWIDYIDPSVIDAFEKITGVKVVLDVFDSNETLEVKLLAGSSGYDIVVPSATPYFVRQLQAGVYQKLDIKKIPLVVNIDPFFLEKLSSIDKNHEYCIPYLWGLSGFAVNVSKIKGLIKEEDLNSWKVLFDEESLKKLSKYHIELTDSASELFPAIQRYLGESDQSSVSTELIEKAGQLLTKIRPYIFKFNSSAVQDLFNKTACIAMGTSGDIRKILIAAKKNGEKIDIRFISPKEGSALWIDVCAVPKGARHPKNAHAFMNFLLHPLVIARITNHTGCANTIPKSKPYINKEISKDPMVYPAQELIDISYTESALPPELERIRTRLFTKIKSERKL